MDYFILSLVINIILFIVSLFFYDRYKKFKELLSNIIDLLEMINESLEDNKINQNELKEIIKRLKTII